MFSAKKVHPKAIFVFSCLKMDIFDRKYSERIAEIPRISNFPPNFMAKFCQVQEKSCTLPNTNLNGDVAALMSTGKEMTVYFSVVILRRPNSLEDNYSFMAKGY